MRGCHRCEHAAEIAAGKYSGLSWPETPCAACEAKEGSAGVMVFNEGQGSMHGKADWSERGEMDAEPEQGEALLPLSVLGEFVAGLMMMSPRTRDAVCWRFQGMKYREIAERQGVSVAAVEKQHRMAMKRWPELRELFVVKARKQGRRRRKRPLDRGGSGARAGAASERSLGRDAENTSDIDGWTR